MKTKKYINLEEITRRIGIALQETCCQIPNDILASLKKAKAEETSIIGQDIIERIIENDEIASFKKVPLCQDTGIVVCFLEIGQDVTYDGDIYEAINEGVRIAYTEGYLRKSVVKHPLNRINTLDNTPAIIHTKIVPGDKITITLMPKGAGSENMSRLKMLTPSDGLDGIKKFFQETIDENASQACPPLVIGVGIGGNMEKAAMLAKESLTLSIDQAETELEKEFKQIANASGIGPMGLGGNITCLRVFISTYPCHIASLPVAINIQCHASRHYKITI